MSWHRVVVVLAVAVLTALPGVADARMLIGTGSGAPVVDTGHKADADLTATTAARRRAAARLACDGIQAIVEWPGRDWRTVVVDPLRRLPLGWAPRDLVAVPELGYRGSDIPLVREVVVDDLRAMHEAATAAEAPFVVVSGFRSEQAQHALWLAAVAKGNAGGNADGPAPDTARPGHSEHQLGTTIDVVDPSLPKLVPGLAATPAGRWLAGHAADYGFVVSYPDGATDRTCFKPEPWHLRHVGVDLAAELAVSDLTPREFLLAR